VNRVDEILAAIDTGLQTAGDTAYGDDWPGTCWRCGEPAEDLCAGCRAALLDETAVAPMPLADSDMRAHMAACPICQTFMSHHGIPNQPDHARSRS
jgi:hypothetical protein